MAFTRFHDDPARVKKQLEESTFSGRYNIDVPGAGMNLPFFEDPQIRMQKWGANLHRNTVNLESDLLGLTRKANRDLPGVNEYQKHKVWTAQLQYSDAKPFIDESRASCPAWMFRDIDNNRWDYPLFNPQNNIERTFGYDIQTRIIEKDRVVYPVQR